MANQLAYVLRQGDSTFLQVVPAFFGGVPSQSIALQPAPNDVRLLRWIDRAIYAQANHTSGRSLYRIDLNAEPGHECDPDVDHRWHVSVF